MNFVYYIVTFSLPFYLNDPVTNGFVMGSCEMIAVFAAIPLIGRWGRRATLLFTYFLALGAGTLAIIFHAVSDDWGFCHIVETLSLGALKFALEGNFSAIAIIITEIFPTVIRDVAFGAASTFARVAAATCPFMIQLFVEFEMNPLICIIPCIILATLTSWKLPETIHKDMPDYILEEKEEEMRLKDGKASEWRPMNYNV